MNGLPEPPIEPPEPPILTGKVTLYGTFSATLHCYRGAGCVSKEDMVAHAKTWLMEDAGHEFEFLCLKNEVVLDGQNPMGD